MPSTSSYQVTQMPRTQVSDKYTGSGIMPETS